MTTLILVAHGTIGTALLVASILAVQARTPERLRRVSGWMLALVLAQTVVGDVLYPIYLREAKPSLRALESGSRSVADVFEIKEHLAFFALVATAGAFFAARSAGTRLTLTTRALVAAAHAAIVLVAALGLVVFSVKHP